MLPGNARHCCDFCDTDHVWHLALLALCHEALTSYTLTILTLSVHRLGCGPLSGWSGLKVCLETPPRGKHRSVRHWIHGVALDGRSCTLSVLESTDEPMGGIYLGQHDLRKRDRLPKQIPALRNTLHYRHLALCESLGRYYPTLAGLLCISQESNFHPAQNRNGENFRPRRQV